MREIRLKGKGLFASYSMEDCGKIGNELIVKLNNIDQYRRSGKAFNGKPLFFGQKLFFLVSLEPGTMLVVPHKFSFRHASLAVGDPYLRDEINENYEALEMKHTVGLRALWTDIDNWLNYMYLSSFVPNTGGIEVISDLWTQSVPLEVAQADARWPFQVIASSKFPGYLEVLPRTASAKKK